MNAVEIEEAVSSLAAAPFNAAEFPFQFLRAFGNKETTIKRLRSASTSDVEGGVLQRNAIHIAVCAEGEVGETLAKLRASPKTAASKVKFILATDGVMLEAEEVNSGETLAPECLNSNGTPTKMPATSPSTVFLSRKPPRFSRARSSRLPTRIRRKSYASGVMG
jgi:hypothetical protein